VCMPACAGTFLIVCPKIKIHINAGSATLALRVCTCVCRLRGATSRTPRTWFARSWAEEGARSRSLVEARRPGRATAPKVQLPPRDRQAQGHALYYGLSGRAAARAPGRTSLRSHFSLQMHIAHIVQHNMRFHPSAEAHMLLLHVLQCT
jgi:hypothetical protein